MQPPDAELVRLYKAYAPAPDVRKAEKSAAGTMPAGAFQYCEAMRTASAFGWYMYPPKDIILAFDGKESFFFEDEQWYPVKSVPLDDDFRSSWAAVAPDDLANLDPPYLSEIFVPGIIQIWSGYFACTRTDWSLLIRPPVNYDIRSSFICFEGLVETDEFYPLPLFINIKLLSTNREIFIPKDKPLFQIQPIHRSCYASAGHQTLVVHELNSRESPFPWEGLRSTLRKAGHQEERRPGNYASSRRKRK